MAKKESITFHGKTSFLKEIDRKQLKMVMTEIAKENKFSITDLQYIIVGDEEILSINNEFLQHDYYTDIITFDLSDTKDQIEGEIYISTDTVKSNSIKFGTPLNQERLRVLFHGLLHLIGFSDKGTKAQKVMRAMEDHCLNLYLQRTGQKD
jgi:probable rRNA maturation factor